VPALCTNNNNTNKNTNLRHPVRARTRQLKERLHVNKLAEIALARSIESEGILAANENVENDTHAPDVSLPPARFCQ
jgi:hypothetical protein